MVWVAPNSVAHCSFFGSRSMAADALPASPVRRRAGAPPPARPAPLAVSGRAPRRAAPPRSRGRRSSRRAPTLAASSSLAPLPASASGRCAASSLSASRSSYERGPRSRQARRCRGRARGGLGDRLSSGVSPQVGDAPALPAQREPEHDQREVVQLAGRAGEHRAWPAPLIPAARQSEQPAAQQRRREVLLGDLAAPRAPAPPVRAGTAGAHRAGSVDAVARQESSNAPVRPRRRARRARPGAPCRRRAPHPGPRGRRGGRAAAPPRRPGSQPARPRRRGPGARASPPRGAGPRASTGGSRRPSAAGAAARSGAPRRAAARARRRCAG